MTSEEKTEEQHGGSGAAPPAGAGTDAETSAPAASGSAEPSERPASSPSGEAKAEEGQGDDVEDPPASAAAREDDEESEDASAEEAPSASGAEKATAKKVGSAGARLAAAKAAKAAKKAARRAQEAAAAAPGGTLGSPTGGSRPREPVEELQETAFGQAAVRAGEWAQTNRSIAIGAVAVLVIAVLGATGWYWYSQMQAQAAGALLREALEIATAEVESSSSEETPDGAEPTPTPTPSPTPPGEEPEERTFESTTARAEAALAAYQRVAREHPGSVAAQWAHLGEGRALLELGRPADARSAYENVLRGGGGDSALAWRAIEGIGFALEAQGEWREAIERYEELKSIDNGAFADVADYHLARMRLELGETVQATTTLRELIERVRGESASSEPEFPYVLSQAETMLRELDPGSVGETRGGGGMRGLEDLPPEIREQLIRQLQQQGQGAGVDLGAD